MNRNASQTGMVLRAAVLALASAVVGGMVTGVVLRTEAARGVVLDVSVPEETGPEGQPAARMTVVYDLRSHLMLWTRGSPSAARDAQGRLDEIIAAVVETVESPRWLDNGGMDARVMYFGHKVIFEAPAGMQRAIKVVLGEMLDDAPLPRPRCSPQIGCSR